MLRLAQLANVLFNAKDGSGYCFLRVELIPAKGVLNLSWIPKLLLCLIIFNCNDIRFKTTAVFTVPTDMDFLVSGKVAVFTRKEWKLLSNGLHV